MMNDGLNETVKDRLLMVLIAFLLVMAVIGWAKYVDEKDKAELWYERYSDEVDELLRVKASLGDTEFMRQACIHDRDLCESDFDAIPVCQNDAERIEFLEGQLESCSNAYSRELTDRLFYQNASDNVSPYCSERLDQLVIDGQRGEIRRLREDYNALLEKYQEVRWERDKLQRDLRGAPCHSHYDGIHCFWESPSMLEVCENG